MSTALKTMTGPLIVSSRNPRYFTGRVRRSRRQGRVPHRVAHLEQLARRNGARRGGFGRARSGSTTTRYLRSSRNTVTTSSGCGAGSSSGRRPPAATSTSEHDAAAVAAHRAWQRQGRQAEVRSRAVRPGLLRSAARTRRRGRRRGHLCRRDVLRRLGLAPQPGARQHRGPSVPRREQRQRDQRLVDRRLQVLPLDPRVQAIQEAYIRKVVDTLHDLPNVLWEVANESSGGGSVDQEFAACWAWSNRRVGATRPSGSTG